MPRPLLKRRRRKQASLAEKIRHSIGHFSYWKRLRTTFVPVTVTVFPFEVRTVLKKWPERKKRQRAWLKVDEAELLVDEPELAALLRTASKGAVEALNPFAT